MPPLDARRDQVVELGGLVTIVAQASNADIEVKRNCTYFLALLAENMEHHDEMVREGALEVIITLAAMEDAELPEELRAMNKAERKAHIATLAKKRASLNDRLKSLNARRNNYLTKTASKADSFDAQVLKQIKVQGAKHGVRF